jgi:hypothetical protein
MSYPTPAAEEQNPGGSILSPPVDIDSQRQIQISTLHYHRSPDGLLSTRSVKLQNLFGLSLFRKKVVIINPSGSLKAIL